MTRIQKFFVVSVVAIGGMAISAAPALAGQRGGGRTSGGSHGSMQSSHQSQAQPRQSTPQRSAPPQQARPQGQTQSPQQPARTEDGRTQGTASARTGASQPSRGNIQGQALARTGSPYAVAVPRGFVSRNIIVPHFVHVYNPYYSFRPRFSLGFGFFVGYPVPFPSWYDPYYEMYPNGYAASSVAPSVAYGGVSFQIDPPGAAIFVDGTAVGTAADFGPNEAPLTLAAGHHYIELRAQGYKTTAFDVTVVAGQVIPYQGTLDFIR